MASQPVRSDSIEKQDVEVDHGEHASVVKPTTLDEKQARLAAAMAADPGVGALSWPAFQMYLILFVACCCSGDSGMDGTVMGGINTMSQYLSFFGLKSADAKTGIVFGVFTLGSLTAALPAAWLPDRFGRRTAMFVGNIILIVGAIVTANAQNRSMLIGGRYVTGIGTGLAGTAAKSFLGELTEPKRRGMFMGFLNSFYYVGQMTATGMMIATVRYTNDYSWRLPLYVQVVPAGLNVLFIWFVPESPRWLYSRGRKDEARQILARLHSATGDPHSPLIELEMEEIVEHVQLDGADKRFWDFRPLFTTKYARARVLRVIIIGFFGQLSGNGMVTYFLPVLLQNAGIKDQNKRITLNFVNSVTSYIGALIGSYIVDKLGRRKLLLIGTAGCTILLAICSGLFSDATNSNEQRSSAGIAMIYLFMVVFSFGWTAMQALYPMEVLPFEARAKGLAFLNICTQLAGCINTFGIPVALEKLGWKVYLIFMFWDAFETVIIYFFVVETRGLSLEQIEEVFTQPNPVKYSIEHKFSNDKGIA